MQKLIKSFVLSALSIYFASLIIPGFVVLANFKSIFIATLALGLLNLFVRPILNLLFLPINIITLGMLRWLINLAILYLLALLLDQVSIQPTYLKDIPLIGYILPSITANRFFTTLLASISISFSQSFLYWLIK